DHDQHDRADRKLLPGTGLAVRRSGLGALRKLKNALHGAERDAVGRAEKAHRAAPPVDEGAVRRELIDDLPAVTLVHDLGMQSRHADALQQNLPLALAADAPFLLA